jgi:lipopolysaccharide transport system ATP-binding protein
MSEIAIKVENLGKVYRIGTKDERPNTFAGTMVDWIKQPARNLRRIRRLTTFGENGKSASSTDSIWALKNVSFEVRQGEVIGIIGQNGAGKSTLLKVLSQITFLTEGRVTLRGRISSLLEVGTGFHPELTGRENVFLNGTILGMTRKEIEAKFDEIVDFSGVEKFIDTPVKHYSSGMRVRLAFSVAAHLEPEILLIDEVLAVGDVEFQKKCLGMMSEVANAGRTVLFVSHNMTAVNALCHRTLLISNGEIIQDGLTSDVISNYLNLSSGESNGTRIWDDPDTAPGSDKARIRSVRVLSNGQPTAQVDSDKPVDIEIEYWNLSPGTRLVSDIKLLDDSGNIVFEATNLPNASSNKTIDVLSIQDSGCYRAICRIPANFLNDLRYHVTVMIASTPPPLVEVLVEQVMAFTVFDTGSMRTPGFGGKWFGLVRPRFEWVTTRLSDFEME